MGGAGTWRDRLGKPAAGGVSPPALLGAAAVVAALNLVPHGETLLYPLALFATWIHETCHALMALACGAEVQGLLVRPDTSGLATYLFDPREFGTGSRALVASAGYVGTALAAAGLLAAVQRPRLHRPVLATLGVGLILTTLLWVRTAFGIIALLLLAAGLGAVVARRTAAAARWTLVLLGLQTALNAVLAIRVLYYAHGENDAATMSELLGLPPAFWATLWLLLGAAAIGWTFLRATRWTGGKER
ncbi:MAG: hypothetical protein GYA57_20110 [Myxococcales bacterium]|nr:hypothetical protein [Myxococcales bacterium]